MRAAPNSKLARDQYAPDARGPLAGVRVLDVSRLVAGNVVSHVLADFGAEVIKIEAPGRGDDLRDLIEDPRFRTNSDRLRNGDAIDAIVADFIRQRTQAESLALFEAAGVTVGPVCDAADLETHPFIQGRHVLVHLPDVDMGVLPMHNIVPRLSETPGAMRMPAPRLGEHNAEIFGALGVDLDELQALIGAGVV